MQRPASYEEIRGIASVAASIFASVKLSCCVIGDTACALYETPRRPKELDLLVLSKAYRREKLERVLVKANADFYLWSPKDPHSKVQVLCYKLPRQPEEHKRGCRVNVLTPNVLNIPDFPRERIQRINHVPVLPLLILLFLKLQNWTDRRITVQSYMRSKQHDDDVKDIGDLLVIARSRGENISRDQLLQWLPLTAVDAALGRIGDFIERYSNSLTNWKVIGYVER